MKKRLIWERQQAPGKPDCYSATADRPLQSRPGKTCFTAVRAIQERSGGWRIDCASAVAGAWMPWEPLDDGTEHTSAVRAMEAAEQILAAEWGAQ